MSKIGNSSKTFDKNSNGNLKCQNSIKKQKYEQKVVVNQPVSVLKHKRKFTNKTTKPSVHFDYTQRVKDENGNIIEEPGKLCWWK